MTLINDLIEGGFWPLQHQDSRFDREQRVMRFACRVIEDPELLIPVPADFTTGPVMGGFLWDSTNYQEQPPIWSFAAPVVRAAGDPFDFAAEIFAGSGFVGERSWQPEKAGNWQGTEPLLAAKNLVTPFELKYPLRWPGVALTSVNLDRQNDLVLPGFAGLVAPHHDGTTDLGTPVWDVAADGGVDDVRQARLQSMMRVYRYPIDGACIVEGFGVEPGGLAWQLGTARTGIAGAGLVADFGGAQATPPPAPEDETPPPGSGTRVDPKPRVSTRPTEPDKTATTPPQVLAAASARGGGPFAVGGFADQHRLGITPDGEPINSLHISTGALYLGPNGDAPLAFESLMGKMFPAPFLVPCHLRLAPVGHKTPCGGGKGLWIWQAESFFSEIPDPEDTGDPFDPGGNGTGTGDGAGEGGRTGTGDGVVVGGGDFVGGAGGGIGGSFFRIAAEQQTRQLSGTSLELAFPAVVWRPQSFDTGADDLRNMAPSSFGEQQRKEWAQQPAVMRFEAAGARVGPEWSLTTQPGHGRYAAGGTASGVLWAMPGELGLELAGVDGLTTSTACFALWETSLCWGTPSEGEGDAVINGWRLRSDGVGPLAGKIYLETLDSSGTAATCAYWQGLNQVQTGSISLDSVLIRQGSYSSEISHLAALSANRTVYLPDWTGYLALTNYAQSWSNTQTFTDTVVMDQDLSVAGEASVNTLEHGGAGSTLAFFGVAQATQPAVPTTLGDVISALQTLGLVALS